MRCCACTIHSSSRVLESALPTLGRPTGTCESPGVPYVTPYFFPPVAGHHGGDRRRGAATIRAEIGFYAMDTMTCIGEGTWTGAKAAADAAATAADLVADRVGSGVCGLSSARSSRRARLLRR